MSDARHNNQSAGHLTAALEFCRDLRRNSDELVEAVKSAEILIAFNNGADGMVLTLRQGLFNSVTGDIASEAVTINTPSLVIGICGTDEAMVADLAVINDPAPRERHGVPLNRIMF